MADIGINEMNEELTFNYTFEQMCDLFDKINSSEVFTNEEKQNITKALDLAENSVPKEEGKGLSTEDFTTAYKEKLDANIPALKKKTITGTTTQYGNINTNIKQENGIVIIAQVNPEDGSATLGIPFLYSNSNLVCCVKTTNKEMLVSKKVTVTVYYLDITDCDIPGETVTASSDEAPENDMEII